MINAAHIGVGISGKEGLQAVQASDYALAQFRFLEKLVLVHGRSNYKRISKLVLYTFFKNIVIVVTQFLFILYAGLSGIIPFQGMLSGFYNLIFTLLPVMFLAVLENDLTPEAML